MLEDHLYWILMYFRYVDNQGASLQQSKMSKQCFEQGISRHGKGDIQRMGVETLQSISNYLGSKLYLMGKGDTPTEVDCTLFAFLSVILYTFPEDFVLRIVVEKRLGNLLQFTKRMKNNFFPDWDEVIGKNSLTELQKEPPARPPPPATSQSDSSESTLQPTVVSKPLTAKPAMTKPTLPSQPLPSVKQALAQPAAAVNSMKQALSQPASAMKQVLTQQQPQQVGQAASPRKTAPQNATKSSNPRKPGVQNQPNKK